MLTHAFRKNYDMAILVAGDEDYIPLVKAVMSEGRKVVLWFVEDGLSPNSSTQWTTILISANFCSKTI